MSPSWFIVVSQVVSFFVSDRNALAKKIETVWNEKMLPVIHIHAVLNLSWDGSKTSSTKHQELVKPQTCTHTQAAMDMKLLFGSYRGAIILNLIPCVRCVAWDTFSLDFAEDNLWKNIFDFKKCWILHVNCSNLKTVSIGIQATCIETLKFGFLKASKFAHWTWTPPWPRHSKRPLHFRAYFFGVGDPWFLFWFFVPES